MRAILHMAARTVVAAAVLFPVHAAAQSGVTLAGRLYNSVTAAPVEGAVVVLEELQRETQSDPQGGFVFTQVPPGTYHIGVRAKGFSSRRTEVDVMQAPLEVDVFVDPELHFQEVVSVSPGARSQFEAYQPTAVLAGQELAQQLDASLGKTLEDQPSMAVRSFGPAPARPVIRGLGGDRVLILQDGQRTGDLSSQSADHAVVANPAAAQRIEVVRGPATLLYGANAIGGLVNVITDEIPTAPQRGVQGRALVDLGSAADAGSAAGDLSVGNGRLALHVGGGGAVSGDVATPLGTVDNSHARSGFGSVGAAWTGTRGYAGVSYGYDESRHGIPVIEEGRLQLTPRRHSITARAGGEGLSGVVDAWRGTLAHRRYRHEELQGAVAGTRFYNDTTEVAVMVSHRAVRRLKGSFGGWLLERQFDAVGEEAISPAVAQRGAALFVYEELTWPHLTLQGGARVDHTRLAPAGEARRRFTNPSFSAGVLYRPAAAGDGVTVAVSLARAVRAPALEELFFLGDHHGNFAFEAGNPDLEPEKALGMDASLRWRSARTSGEVTYFRNGIDDYIFRRPLTEEEFDARAPVFAARFPGRDVRHAHGEEHIDLQLIEYVGADALLQGVEAHADVQITAAVIGQVGYDYVRGTLRASGAPLPRMPPSRLRAALRYQRPPFQAGGEVVRARAQTRVFGAETPTEGYTLLDLFATYSFVAGQVTNTASVRLDNATNALYRNHLSLIKSVVPEMGRNLKVLYSIAF